MLNLFKVFMSEEAIENTVTVLRSGYITEGQKVKDFENLLSKFIGSKVLATNSATSALTLCFRLLIEPDEKLNWPGFNVKEDVVLCTPLTCTASNWSVLANNMNIKWVDIDPDTVMMDLKDLESKLTAHTKIILLVHWGGVPLDLEHLDEILDKHEVNYGFRPRVVEDGAHAFGASFNDRRIGNHGNLCVFSFQAIKHLTAGDGGCICFPAEYTRLFERAKKLRWFGIDRDNRGVADGDFRMEDDIAEFGYKFHMNDINASIGIGNLGHVSGLLEKCRKNANLYRKLLQDEPQVILLTPPTKSNPSYWLFTIRVIDVKKSNLIAFMAKLNIMVSQVHKRNDLHSCVSQFKSKLPALDQVVNELICFPCGWWITEKDVARVVKCLHEFICMNRSSYKQLDLNYGDLLNALSMHNTHTCVEFGILDGYSTRILAGNCAHVKAFDIFDDFNGNSPNKATLKLPENVEVAYGNLFDSSLVRVFKDKSIDILHVDIANDAAVVDHVLNKWHQKITTGGMIVFEGGSKKRDEVQWMKEYNKQPMYPYFQRLDKLVWKVRQFGEFPSLTVVTKIHSLSKTSEISL